MKMMRQIPAWNSSGLRPPGVYHNWDLRIYTEEEISNRTHDIIIRTKRAYDEVARAKNLCFDTVLKVNTNQLELLPQQYNQLKCIRVNKVSNHPA